MKRRFSRPVAAGLLLFLAVSLHPSDAWSKSSKKRKAASSAWMTAKAAVIVDASTGNVLYDKNSRLRLPPASTTKVMTVLVALEHLPLNRAVVVSQHASDTAPSKAGLTAGASYWAKDLALAALVASSNDAAVALAEEVAGSEKAFARLMNEKAAALGMRDTHFINATGLPEKGVKQYSSAYDLTILMRRALKDPRIDAMLGIQSARFAGSDARVIEIRTHNKMLWKRPGLVKGKTGWTFASRHTFVGTDFSPQKKIAFAMLSSKEPWTDIERLVMFGLALHKKA